MRSEFELKSLNEALQRLLKAGILKNEEQKQKLYNLYKNDPRKYSLIHKEINDLRFNEKLLQDLLKKDELIAGKNANTIDTTKKVEYALSVENITDFEKDGKSYIKIHYPYPYDNVRIIENTTDPHKSGKERFEELQGTQKIMSTDGQTNATSIFEQTLVRDCNEIEMVNLSECAIPSEFEKLSGLSSSSGRMSEREIVYGTLKSIISSLDVSKEEKERLNSDNIDEMLKILGQKVYISPKENIVVNCVENSPELDEVKTLEYQIDQGKRKYSLKPLDGKGYKHDSEVSLEDSSNDEANYGNEEYEKEKTDELEKELGPSYSLKRNNKKKKNEAAFISLLWFVIFAGVIAAIVLASIISMLLK